MADPLHEALIRMAQQPEPVAAVAKNATAQFDHAIGADRFKVVRGAFWWHVLIGDSTKKHGKFHSRAGAEQMAADLLREFRNGAFVQHTAPPTLRAALVLGVGLAKVELMTTGGNAGLATRIVEIDNHLRERLRPGQLLYTTPPQRPPLTDEEIAALLENCIGSLPVAKQLIRAVEAAHSIKEAK